MGCGNRGGGGQDNGGDEERRSAEHGWAVLGVYDDEAVRSRCRLAD